MCHRCGARRRSSYTRLISRAPVNGHPILPREPFSARNGGRAERLANTEATDLFHTSGRHRRTQAMQVPFRTTQEGPRAFAIMFKLCSPLEIYQNMRQAVTLQLVAQLSLDLLISVRTFLEPFVSRACRDRWHANLRECISCSRQSCLRTFGPPAGTIMRTIRICRPLDASALLATCG